MSLDLHFDNSYARLPDQFYTRLDPTPVETPRLLALNDRLARSLGLDASGLKSPEGVAALAGNLVPGGAEPLAQVYGGHQFGHWAGRLGDGRAILLGEVVTGDGHRFDIQLKGSGPTPYSRMGDGRAWLGPVLREYVVSEAMAALGIPTTRALAAVATGETVVRERAYPGAVLTRVAASHLRVGTFQFFAATGDRDALEALTDYAIERHYPGAEGALGLLEGVVARQATLVADWMAVGFVHGVMNTDNTTISGETIDYGPCAFIDAYHPMRVFSSIDSAGRYAYARQPDVMMWNLAQFAGALLPLIGETETAQRAIDRFPEIFQKAWLGRFGAKLGIEGPEKADADLIHGLLDLMAAGGSDFTNTFRALGTAEARDEFADRDAFADWEARWRARLARDGTTPEDRIPAMSRVNPAVIPRTHRIEQAIQKALAGNLGLFERLNAALARPYELPDDFADLALPPSEEEIVPRTFCGT